MRNAMQTNRTHAAAVKPKSLVKAVVPLNVVLQTAGAAVTGGMIMHLFVLAVIYQTPDLTLANYASTPEFVALFSVIGAWTGVWVMWIWQGVFDNKPEE